MRASMKTKTILTTALCAAFATAAIAHDKDGENLKTHDLSGFTEIDVAGVYNLDVTVGEDFSVTTSGSDKEVEYMDVYVKNGVLTLGTKKGKRSWNVGNKQGIHAVVTMPKLDGMDVAGVATGDVIGIDTDDLGIDVAGIAELTLEGRCRSLELDIAGMGEVDAEGLECENVDVDIAGMGEATVFASESVDADAAGMGQINVYGKPSKVSKSDNFMSKVKIK